MHLFLGLDLPWNRETRRLEGMYSVTYDDVAMATKFKDGIVACDNPLDEVFRDENTTHYSHEAALKEGYYTIPFSALVPKKSGESDVCWTLYVS